MGDNRQGVWLVTILTISSIYFRIFQSQKHTQSFADVKAAQNQALQLLHLHWAGFMWSFEPQDQGWTQICIPGPAKYAYQRIARVWNAEFD